MALPILKTPLFNRNFNSLLFGLVFSIIVVLVCVLMYRNMQDSATAIKIATYLGPAMTFLSFYIIYYMVTHNFIFVIYEDKIEVFNIWGKKVDLISFSQIHSWAESKETDKYRSYYSLTLFCGNYKINLDSDFSGEDLYAKVKEMVMKIAPENKIREIRHSIYEVRIWLVMFIIMWIALGYSLLTKWFGGLNQYHSGKFKSENFEITRPPEYEYNKSDNRLLLYVTKPNPKTTFTWKLDDANPDEHLDTLILISNLIEAQNDTTLNMNDSTAKSDTISKQKKEENIEISDYVFDAINIPKLTDSLREGDIIWVNYITANNSTTLEKLFGKNDSQICGISFDNEEKYLTFKQFMAARHKANIKSFYGLAVPFIIVSVFILLSILSISQQKIEMQNVLEVEE